MAFSHAANMEKPTSPFPSLEVLYKYKLLNTPDTPPHNHHGASVAVHVLTGSVLNKTNDDPMTIKKAGDSFYEAPGCRYPKTEEASIIATFVLETDKMGYDY